MQKQYKCPKCGGNQFAATAHVTQDWLLNEYGHFVECTDNCVETTHYPNEDDIWDCKKCKYSNAGVKFLIGTE